MKKPVYNKRKEDTLLFNSLRTKVNSRISSISADRDWMVKFKTCLLPVLYLSAYFTAILHVDRPWLYAACFVFMGLLIVLIYLNVIHEAAHHNIFKTKKYNRWVLKIFDFIGANSFIWERRHVLSHHSFPNVDGWDTDVEQSGPIKVYPYGKAKGIQKYQHRFFFIIYPLYLFNWMFIRDFRDFFDQRRVIQKTQAKISGVEKVKLIFFKLFYFFYQIAVPVFFLGASWKLAVGSWFLQIILASCFALFVLLPVHAVEHNKFPLVDREGNLPYSWFRHQLEVTNDLSNHNQFIRYVLGNFNYHVAHHLFPNYTYEYYQEITDEIRKFAVENALSYKEYPLFIALRKHYNLLKSNTATVGEMMEESM